MGRYAKLGTLAVRLTAVGFFVLAVVFLPFGIVGGWGGPMMGNGVQAGGPGAMMGTDSAMWWGPVLLNVAMGAFLFALSKPIGSALATGLDD
jgi:hypothetical protein